MKRLITLYLKELNGNWLTIAVTAGVIVLLNLFLYIQSFWEPGLTLGISVMVVSLLVVLGLAFGTVLDREWSVGTAYWLLSLPVSGYTILGAKFGLALTFLALNLLAAVGGVLFTGWAAGVQIPLSTVAWVYLYSLGIGILAVLISFLARTAGLLVQRWRLPVVVGVFIATIWTGERFARMVGEWLSFLPDLTLATGASWHQARLIDGAGFWVSFSEVSPGPFLAWTLYGMILFFLTGWLLDQRVEI